MVRSGVLWGGCMFLASALAWVGCVADQPDSGGINNGADASGPGSEGQACFANGTCDEGLTCLSNVCVREDGGSSGGDGGATNGDGSATNKDGAAGGDGSTAPDGAATATCGSASFSGATQVITAPSIAAYNPATYITVEAWVYPTSYPSTGFATIAAHDINAPTMRGWSLALDHTGALTFTGSTDGTALAAAKTTIPVPLNAWSHVVGEYDIGGQLYVILNGTNSQSANFPSAAVLNSTPAPLTIGNSADGSAPFAGKISEVRFSNQYLYQTSNSFSPDPRLSNVAGHTLALFHLNDSGTTAIDSSTTPNNATVQNGVSFVNACTPDICNWLDIPPGNIPNVTVNAPSPNVFDQVHSFTFEGWFRETGSGGWNVSHGGQGGYGFFLTNPANRLDARFTCQGGANFDGLSNNPLLHFVWYHFAAVFDAVAKTLTTYVNGVSQGAVATTCAAAASITGDGLDFSVGTTNIGSNATDMAEFRLSQGVRYTADFHPERNVRFTPDANTIALYHFDETSGTIAHEASGDGGLNGGLNGTTLPVWQHCGM